jgi:tetratricopeptide (TPR) repeat protein
MPLMSRPVAALAVLLILPFAATAADPDPVEKALSLQKAMASAEQFLAANMPAEAVGVLEAELSNADGNKAYLAQLRRAYAAEVRQLELSPTADPNRLAQSRRKLTLLGGPEPAVAAAAVIAPPTGVAPVVLPAVAPAGDDQLRDARALFTQGKYAEAGQAFAAAAGRQAPLTEADAALWAYCRIKLAADRVNAPACDAATAAAAEKEIAAALQLAPNNVEFQHVGRKLLAVARQKQHAPALPNSGLASPDRELGGSWQLVETSSFRVRYQGDRAAAERLATAAEAKRKEIFERWSGPPAAAWDQLKCEVVLHPTADGFAKMTQRPAGATGHAMVKLTGGRPTERRIDVRTDDPVFLTNALPRELTHVVLADLFPHTPPPKWAEEGMAVLAGDPDEIGRFVRTLPRCHRDGQLLPLAALMDLKEFPEASRITGFYCESVTLVDYLVKLKGERAFTNFLRDCQRYGTASALKRTYGFETPQALETAWRQTALDTARGQKP